MVVVALGLLSVELWLTVAVTILLALRLHRAFQLSERLIAATAWPRPQHRSYPVR